MDKNDCVVGDCDVNDLDTVVVVTSVAVRMDCFVKPVNVIYEYANATKVLSSAFSVKN